MAGTTRKSAKRRILDKAASAPRPRKGVKEGDRELRPPMVKPIAAVERALQVISSFRREPRLTLSELSETTHLFKSTLLRILATLERNGYVMRLDDGRYGLGGLLYELGSSYVASFRLEEVIKPALAELSETTGESASFYVRSGDQQRQCIFRVESPQALRHVIDVGQIVDLDRAATSQLFRKYDGSKIRPTASTDYSTLCIATSGIGDPQTASVAAPIFGTDGLVGVINVSGPVSRFTDAAASRILIKLAIISAKISGALGGVLRR